jgi:DNA modification methylase
MSASGLFEPIKKLSVSYVAIAAIQPAARNPRTHSPAQIAQIARSIAAFGWTNPILIDEHARIIAGHGRLAAAQQLGLAEVPTITLAGLTDAQVRALVIADNQLALNAGWDAELLQMELGELGADGFDLSLIGFSDDELASILADRTDGLTDPDDVPDAPAEPVSVLGDVWLLGRHRLVCGDATSEVDVSLCLGAVRPHLMVTDPPWGVNYDPDWRNKSPTIGWSRSRSIGTVENDQQADWRQAWMLFPGDIAYTWSPPGTTQIDHYNSLVAGGFEIRMQIIWAKSHFPIGRGNYHVQHEPCWYAVRKGKTGHWQGDRKQSTLWQIENRTAFKGGMTGTEDAWSGHSTQKPVECMRRPIENNSSPGQAVYDPFVGSGTTIIAAEMTGRAAHTIEISPAYCDVTILRWQAFTGQTATHALTGRNFADTAAERAPQPAEAA